VKPYRSVLSVSVALVGLLGLSACGGEEPSGLAVYTPGANGSAAPSATSTSKWTPEQQQVIDGYEGFNDLIATIMSKAETIDLAKAHKVAKEPFATTYLKGVDSTISAGFVQKGKIVRTVSSVTVDGDAATIRTCVDQTHMKLVNTGKNPGPAVQVPPPSWQTVSVVRQGDSWLVDGLKSDGGTCVSG